MKGAVNMRWNGDISDTIAYWIIGGCLLGLLALWRPLRREWRRAW